ncbi:MAG: hypothetical protein ACHREM_33430, partial [Polyangiales bacterium]
AAGASAGYGVSSGGTDAGFRPPFNVEGAWVPPVFAEIPRTPGRDDAASSSRRGTSGNGALWVAVGVVISLTIGAVAWILWPSSANNATDARPRMVDAAGQIVVADEGEDARPDAKVDARSDEGADVAPAIDAAPIDAARISRPPLTSARPFPSVIPSLPPSTLPSTLPKPDAGRGPDIIEIPLPWPVPVRGGP